MNISLLTTGAALAFSLLLSTSASSAILFSTAEKPFAMMDLITGDSARAQQFTIHDHLWTISSARFVSNSFRTALNSELRATIYSGINRPETLVSTLINPDEWGSFTPSETLVLGPGSYWFVLEQGGVNLDNVTTWHIGDPETPTSSYEEYLDYFSLGSRAVIVGMADGNWNLYSNTNYRVSLQGELKMIPEPGSLALVVVGAIGLSLLRRRRG